jgi:hypothetical protein
MALDEELLRKAQAAGARLAEAEHQVQLARADYHAVVRRLHLAGGSLREVAQALALSHQRIQQIVDVAGGSWWQRIWRTRNIKRDAVCTFCERPPSEVAKLIAGPDVYICDSCVALAEEAITGGSPTGTGGLLATAKKGAKARCSFCGHRGADRRPVVTAAAANVCSECLRLCREILDDRAA